MEALGAAAKFAGGLGAAEHEEAEDGGLISPEIENCPDPVLVFGDASISDRGNKGKILKRVEGLTNFFFGQIEHRVAARALIACIQERVEGKRIVLGSGDLFFDEGAKDSELVGGELHGYKVATGSCWRVERPMSSALR